MVKAECTRCEFEIKRENQAHLEQEMSYLDGTLPKEDKASTCPYCRMEDTLVVS